MKNFFVVTNKAKDSDGTVTGKVVSYLESKGMNCTICQEDLYKNDKRPDMPENIDYIIVIGGDGTLIGAVRSIRKSIPILGINMGTLGYLTEVEIDHLEEALEQVIAEDYMIENRMMLEGTINDGEVDIALNEIVLTRKGVLRMLHFHVYVNGELLNTYAADGIIISTPTGSTAYNLSAGGPIVEPTASMFVITPICPHSLNTSSIVLSAEDEICIVMGEGRHGSPEEFYVSFDGTNTKALVSGDSVTIRRSRHTTKLMKLNKTSFLEILRKKMKGN